MASEELALIHIIHENLRHAVDWLRMCVEAIGVLVVGLGALIATYQFFFTIIMTRTANFVHARFTMARYLAVALEFQLGADILSTAIAPTWDQVGKLAAIAVIRTGLNFFLAREMKEQQETIEKEIMEKHQAQKGES